MPICLICNKVSHSSICEECKAKLPKDYELCGTCNYDHNYDMISPQIALKIKEVHREFTIYSAKNQGYYTPDMRWSPLTSEARTWETLSEANKFIAVKGWVNSTRADIDNSAYAVELVS